MWSGRVSQPLDEQFEQWQRSFGYDRRLLRYECRASAAYGVALARAGILAEDEAQQIAKALGELGAITPDAAAALDTAREAEDVHHFVELELIRRLGDLGRKLHTGRSRNEQIATDLRLFTRDAIAETLAGLRDVCHEMVKRARSLATATMPSYTHLQRAEPILAAHWLLAYVEMFLRDAERLRDCRRRVNVLPLGSGPIAGCTIPLDREALARDLEFAAVSQNSMDATSDRDFALEFVNALGLIALHLGRFAEDMVLYSTVEFGFVRLPDSFATGSSALPQKKNPDFAELLRGKTARVLAAGTQLAITIKGLPMSYNRDLQETQEPLFAAAESIGASLALAARFVCAVEFDTDRMLAAASSGYMNATAAANYLVRKGVPFRRAHEIVGQAVRLGLEKKRELQQLAPEDLRTLMPEFGPDFAAALTLDRVVAEHDVIGGTAPARVEEALRFAEQRIAALEEKAHAHA